jgi:hypothetical protein
VLFELIGSRYERRSMLITANQPFGAWTKVFPDQAMTLAAIDRLVRHATILEMNVESYRRRAALYGRFQLIKCRLHVCRMARIVRTASPPIRNAGVGISPRRLADRGWPFRRTSGAFCERRQPSIS